MIPVIRRVWVFDLTTYRSDIPVTRSSRLSRLSMRRENRRRLRVVLDKVARSASVSSMILQRGPRCNACRPVPLFEDAGERSFRLMDPFDRGLQLKGYALFTSRPDALLEVLDRVMNGVLRGFGLLHLMRGFEAVEDRPRDYDSRVEVVGRRKAGAHRAVAGRRSGRRKVVAARLLDLRAGRSRFGSSARRSGRDAIAFEKNDSTLPEDWL